MSDAFLQLFRSASSSFGYGNRLYSANAASLVTKQTSSSSAGTIPSINVSNGNFSGSSNALKNIIDIIANMDKPKPGQNPEDENYDFIKSLQFIDDVLASKNADTVVSVSVSEGGGITDIIKGSEGNDVINYASSGRAVTAYLDAGGGDDVINLVSTVDSNHNVWGGAGNDTISYSAQHGRVDGGEGDDVIAVTGRHVGADGGSGDDVISISGAVISASGGDGNDIITAVGDVVGGVRGGDGDDIITVTSDNRRYLEMGQHAGMVFGGDIHPTTLTGGKGNDTININGEGRVIMRAGDGQDVINITDRTEFQTFGEIYYDNIMDIDESSFSYENGELTVSFKDRDEKITIRSEGRELSWEITDSFKFVVTLK